MEPKRPTPARIMGAATAVGAFLDQLEEMDDEDKALAVIVALLARGINLRWYNTFLSGLN